jgi:hypothetical protein
MLSRLTGLHADDLKTLASIPQEQPGIGERRLSEQGCEWPYSMTDTSADALAWYPPPSSNCSASASACQASYAASIEASYQASYAYTLTVGSGDPQMGAKHAACWCEGDVKFSGTGNTWALDAQQTTAAAFSAHCVSTNCRAWTDFSLYGTFLFLCSIGGGQSCTDYTGIYTMARESVDCMCELASTHDFVLPLDDSQRSPAQQEAGCASSTCRRSQRRSVL